MVLDITEPRLLSHAYKKQLKVTFFSPNNLGKEYKCPPDSGFTERLGKLSKINNYK